MKRFLMVGLLALLPVASHAQAAAPATFPAIDIHRLSIAAGADYQWLSSTNGGTVGDPSQEWTFGAFGAYAISKNLSVVGAEEFGSQSNVLRSRVGVRFFLFNGARMP